MDRPNIQEHIRTLVSLQDTGAPLISAYIDLSDPIALDRLRSRARTVRTALAREDRTPFDRAFARIEGTIDSWREGGARGAALFCREGEQPFFLDLRFQVELPTELSVDSLPHVFRLVELKDTYDRYVILILSEEEARILEVNLGEVTRQLWSERPALRERVGREWTRRHFQNHRRERTEAFYREVVELLERRMRAGGFPHFVIAGNPRAIGLFRPHLPKSLESRAIELGTHVKNHAPNDLVRSTIGSLVEREQLETLETVRLLKAQVRRGGLAVVGRDATRAALEEGAGDILVICTHFGEDEESRREREELVRLADVTGASIEVVQNSELLESFEGCGCLLRYAREDVPQTVA